VGQVGGAEQGAEVYLKQGHGGIFRHLVEISLLPGETREHNFQPSFFVIPHLHGSLGKGVKIGFSDTCDMSGSGREEAQAVVRIL
jgi:hypothetical protein